MRCAIQRQSALVARGEVRFIGENGSRPFRSAAPSESGLKFDFKMDEECAGRGQQEVACVFAFDGAAAEGQDEAFAGEKAEDGGVFDIAEGALALAGEDLGDGRSGFGFDDIVHVNESPVEAFCNERANGRFAGAHESGEDNANGRC